MIKQYPLKLDAALFEQLKKLAEREQRSVNNFISVKLAEVVEKSKEKNNPKR